MQMISATDVQRLLSFEQLIPAFRAAFAGPAGTPRRSVYRLDPSGGQGAFAVLPAWNADTIGVKAFTYLPENASRGRPILHSQVLLFDRATGEPRALVDGTTITLWRSAAVAALAADSLARADSDRVLICGTGAMAPYLVRAHAAVRKCREIVVWGRDRARAEAVLTGLRQHDRALPCRVAGPLENEVASADIICCATASPVPLFDGALVRPGTHVTLLGNHERDQRECDTTLVTRARVYVDSRENVLNEAGELLIPIGEGSFQEDDIVGELADLCAGRVPGRRSEDEITLFKSVGTALSDLVAAALVVDLAGR